MREQGPYPEEIQERRDDLAQRAKAERATAESKEQKARHLSSRLKGLVSRPDGTPELRQQAQQHRRQAKEMVRVEKGWIEHRHKEIERHQEYERRRHWTKAAEEFPRSRYSAEVAVGCDRALSETEQYWPNWLADSEAGYYHLELLNNIARQAKQAAEQANDPTSQAPYEQLNRRAVDIMANNCAVLNSELSDSRSRILYPALEAMSWVAHYGQREQQLAAKEFLTTHLFRIDTPGQSCGYGLHSVVENMYATGDPDLVAELEQRLRPIIERGCREVNGDLHIIGRMQHMGEPGMREFIAQCIKERIAEYGLDSDRTLAAWNIAGRSMELSLYRNFTTMNAVESERPGILKTLQSEYGINDFFRYPAEILVRQYDERERTDLPYGIVLFPEDDHNGSYGSNVNIFEQIDKQTRGHMAVRIFECGSKIDIARIFLTIRRRYQSAGNKDNKISFAIFGGHGSKYGITVGPGHLGHIFQDATAGRGAQRLKDFFRESATLVLLSCSTGKRGGIGQRLSERLGLRVLAPDVDTSPASVTVSCHPDGSADVDVSYGKQALTMDYRSGLVDTGSAKNV